MSEPLPVLVAPDSFKGTFDAAQVAAAIARGLRDAGQPADEMPVADGGEGTQAALLTAIGGEERQVTATGPLGDPVEASFALLSDGRTAVVEVAAASGLSLVPDAERDAFAASSYGTGELIAAAVEAGAETVVVGVGGSATMEGGAGALEALRDAGAKPPEIICICDTRTPFENAPRVFGPQKGADPDTVKRLEQRFARLG
jgi:glycerate 2-kinase